MINFYNANIYCCDDTSLIENYEEAINDQTQTWDCHHRLEIDMNLSRKELIERDLYYNRPASELIFLTHSEHQQIHKIGKESVFKGHSHTKESREKNRLAHLGEKNYWYVNKQSEETRKKRSESMKKYWSIPRKGRLPFNTGKHRVYDENGKFHYE